MHQIKHCLFSLWDSLFFSFRQGFLSLFCCLFFSQIDWFTPINSYVHCTFIKRVSMRNCRSRSLSCAIKIKFLFYECWLILTWWTFRHKFLSRCVHVADERSRMLVRGYWSHLARRLQRKKKKRRRSDQQIDDLMKHWKINLAFVAKRRKNIHSNSHLMIWA
jgi:hypothetical protein